MNDAQSVEPFEIALDWSQVTEDEPTDPAILAWIRDELDVELWGEEIAGTPGVPPDTGADGESESPRPVDNRLTLASVVDVWRASGPTEFIPTGISEIDALFGGQGVPSKRRVVLVGAPGAGKTALAVAVADAFDIDGRVLVGFMAVDEEAEELGYRFAQMAGCDREKLATQDPRELDRAAGELGKSTIVFYNYADTLDFAVEDLATRAAAVGKRPALFVDSLNTAVCEATLARTNPTARDSIEASIAVLERANKKHGMFILATAEANRATYSNDLNMQNKKAAGAESRKIEFSFETQLVLTADDAGAAVTEFTVAKNRKYFIPEKPFSLRLNRDAHRWESVDATAERVARKAAKDAGKLEDTKTRTVQDAVHVARAIAECPGITRNDLVAALKAKHGSFSNDRREAGSKFLGPGLVKRSGTNNREHHYIDGGALPPEVLAVAPELATMRPSE